MLFRALALNALAAVLIAAAAATPPPPPVRGAAPGTDGGRPTSGAVTTLPALETETAAVAAAGEDRGRLQTAAAVAVER